MKKMTILRWSLLATIGLLPLACSSDDDEPPLNTGGKAGSGGTAGTAGTAGKGGSSGSAGKDSGGAGAGTLGGAGGGDGGVGGHQPIGKPPTCTSPQIGDDGITTCMEGYHYREKPSACAFRADQGPDAGGAGSGGASAGGAGGSAAEADPIAVQCFPACEGEHAYCRAISATPIITACSRGCLTDDECGTNELCQCDAVRGGVCVPASCRGDADCDDGYHCAQAQICTGLHTGSFACQTPEDECVTEKDCDHASCGLDLADESHRVCYEGLSCG